MDLKKTFFAFLLGCAALAVHAGSYFVSPEAVNPGETLWHRHQPYEVGVTAFASLGELMAAVPEANSEVYFAPGTYADNATINVEGLKLYGANAFNDPRATARGAASVITGRLTVNADNIEVNGFDFTDNGQVYNNDATNTAPLRKFTYQYNVVQGSTLTGAENPVRLGTCYTDATAQTDAAQNRYVDTRVAHNIFRGPCGADWVRIGGATGFTTFDDNLVEGGANSFALYNSGGSMNFGYNKFVNVGATNEAAGGNFCVMVYYSGYYEGNGIHIVGNDFNGCIGQKSWYALIRVYGSFAPKSTQLEIVNNTFRNKKQIHADYNYLCFMDASQSANVTPVIRGNIFDNRNYCFGMLRDSNTGELQRTYADNFAVHRPKNATFGTHRATAKLPRGSVMQSFDYDPRTGDYYFVQQDDADNQATYQKKYGDPENMVLVHWIKADSKWSKMILVWVGHCNNMAICRVNGTQYVFTGGYAELNGTRTYSHGVTWFPYHGGSPVVDARQSSYTLNGVSYPIGKFKWEGRNNVNPSVDEVSRLIALRARNGSTCEYGVWDLDQFMANPTGAKMLGDLKVTVGSNPTNATGDGGHNSFSNQGFTVEGDYIYQIEGVGKGSADAIGSKPTVFIDCYNWRTNSFVWRKRITQDAVINVTHGEPEGIKVRRRADGHAELLFGLATGSLGDRSATIFKYAPNTDAASAEHPVYTSTHVPNVQLLTFNASNLTDALTQTVQITNTNLNGNLNATISGSKSLSVSIVNNNPWQAVDSRTSTATVTYRPDYYEPQAMGYLRLSAPTSNDVVIPISITNSAATGINDVETSSDEAPVEYFNLQGQKLTDPAPGQLLIKKQGTNAIKIRYQ